MKDFTVKHFSNTLEISIVDRPGFVTFSKEGAAEAKHKYCPLSEDEYKAIIEFANSSDFDKLFQDAITRQTEAKTKAETVAKAETAKVKASANEVRNMSAPAPRSGQSQEEYYDSDEYYNWKHRMDNPGNYLHDQNLPPRKGGQG